MDTSFLMGWLGGTLLPLGAIWLLFRLGLRRERCFGYNRALLLLAPVVAVVLPLLPRPPLAAWLAPAAAPGVAGPAVALPALGPALAGPAARLGPGAWLLGLYLLGVAALLAALAYRYARLHRATWHLPRERRTGYVLACTGGRLPTSSFGRTVFWDDTAGLTPAEAAAVLAHELAHVRQGHSRDVLWLELWRALLWFNPFAHLLLPALRLTHELLADGQATRQLARPADALAPAPPYAALLARLAARRAVGYSPLAQSFAFSFTLTRIAMLQNEIPVRRWKQWLALPVLGGVFLATACQSNTTDAVRPTLSKDAREAVFITNVKEALRQDSLHNGGKGWKDETSTLHVSKDGTVTITHQNTGLMPPSLAPETSGAVTSGKVYTYVDQMPELPGKPGVTPIVQQIQADLAYPSGMRQEGKVFVSFTVLADGRVGDTKIVKSLAPAYDEAVVAAIRKLPRFVPGRQGGQPAAVSFTVPVLFKTQP